jgi:hypothetical protein
MCAQLRLSGSIKMGIFLTSSIEVAAHTAVYSVKLLFKTIGTILVLMLIQGFVKQTLR